MPGAWGEAWMKRGFREAWLEFGQGESLCQEYITGLLNSYHERILFRWAIHSFPMKY